MTLDVYRGRKTTIQHNERNSVVEWLETLDYGAESRRRVMSLNPGFAIRRLEISLYPPSSKWVPTSNQERIRQRKKRNGLRFSYVVPKIHMASDPNCPYGY